MIFNDNSACFPKMDLKDFIVLISFISMYLLDNIEALVPNCELYFKFLLPYSSAISLTPNI